MKDSLSRCGIYGIFRIGTDECYVGQSVNIRKRWHTHRYDLSRGQHSSIYLQRVHDKNGREAFEFRVLELIDDSAGLNAAEEKWIGILQPTYNHAPVAGSCLGVRHTDATKDKHRQRMLGNTINRGRPSHRRGVTLSEDTRRKISDSKRGIPNLKKRGFRHTEESKKKMSENRRGKGTKGMKAQQSHTNFEEVSP